MEQIRILQVLGGLNRGGAETMVMNLYRAIDKNLIQFDFVIHNEGERAYFDEINSLGGKIFIFKKFNPCGIGLYKKQWKKFFSEHPEYKIVHSHVRSYATFIFEIAHKYGLKTISHSHSTSNGKGFGAILKKIFQYPLRYQADYLYACSTEAGKWLFGKDAIKRPNYKMIKNAIDTKKFAFNDSVRMTYRKEMNLENKIVYGHVGRLAEPKNHRFLLNIFSALKKENKQAVLMLIGEGPYRNNVEKQIKELGLSDSVIMLGWRSDINNLLMAMDVFLFPSIWEGLPVAVIEAQAAGLPCLISDKVTTEVAVSEAVTYLSINHGVACWKAAAEKVVGIRYNVVNQIKKAGFDVETSAAYLMSEYMGMLS